MHRWSRKLEWYTLRWDTNSDKIKNFNIFYDDFNERIKKKIYNKEITSLAQLKQDILQYCRTYWSRVEYEIVVSPLIQRPNNIKEEKIDVFYQVEMNINRITDYVNKELNLELE